MPLILCAVSVTDAQQPGAVTKPRICVVSPDVQFAQAGSTADDPAAPVRSSLVSYLSGPAADVVPLQSRVAVQVRAEASQQGCGFIVETALMQKKAGKGLSMKGLLAAVPSITNVAPLFSTGGASSYATAAAVSAAAEGVSAMQQQSSQEDLAAAMGSVAENTIKAGDQVSLKYNLYRLGTTTPIKSNELKAKASANGEDVMSPLIKQTASEVLEAAMTAGG